MTKRFHWSHNSNVVDLAHYVPHRKGGHVFADHVASRGPGEVLYLPGVHAPEPAYPFWDVFKTILGVLFLGPGYIGPTHS
jgi:hypothetical protein